MQAVAKGMELGVIDEAVLKLIEECGRNLPGGLACTPRGYSDPQEIRRMVLEHIRESFAAIAGRVG